MEICKKRDEMTIGDKLDLWIDKISEELAKIYEWYNVVCKLQKRFK